MSSMEKSGPEGPGTMQGLDTPPRRHGDTIKRRLEQQSPPPRYGERTPTVPVMDWADHELPEGAPQSPGIEALVERDKRYAAEGAPGRQDADTIPRIEAQGPPPRTV